MGRGVTSRAGNAAQGVWGKRGGLVRAINLACKRDREGTASGVDEERVIGGDEKGPRYGTMMSGSAEGGEVYVCAGERDSYIGTE